MLVIGCHIKQCGGSALRGAWADLDAGISECSDRCLCAEATKRIEFALPSHMCLHILSMYGHTVWRSEDGRKGGRVLYTPRPVRIANLVAISVVCNVTLFAGMGRAKGVHVVVVGSEADVVQVKANFWNIKFPKICHTDEVNSFCRGLLWRAALVANEAQTCKWRRPAEEGFLSNIAAIPPYKCTGSIRRQKGHRL